MAQSNRTYSDAKILKYLEHERGLIVPGTVRGVAIEVDYDTPIGNGERQAIVSISLKVDLSAEEANAMLDEAR